MTWQYYKCPQCGKMTESISACKKHLCLAHPEMRICKIVEFPLDTYIEDAKKDNRQHLVDLWNEMKRDKQKHLEMLREALEKEAKEQKLIDKALEKLHFTEYLLAS